MKPHEAARTKIMNDLGLNLTLEKIRLLESTLSWLFNKGAAKALVEIDKGCKKRRQV